MRKIGGVQQYSYEDTHRTIDEVEEKLCLKCEIWYPCNISHFHKNKHNRDGLLTYCKECQKEKERIKYNKNPENKRIYQREVNISPIGKARAKKVLGERKSNGYQKSYYERNSDQWGKYREDRKHKKHEISDIEWESCKIYFHNECAYCGLHISEHFNYYARKLIWTDFHREHVNDEGANDLSNCVPSCKNCNSQKWIHPLNEWYNIYHPNYLISRINKILSWLEEDHIIHIEK